MKNWTNDAKNYFEKRLNEIADEDNENSSDITEDIRSHVYEKIKERNIIAVTKYDIENIINDMGFQKESSSGKRKKSRLSDEIKLVGGLKIKRGIGMALLIGVPVLYVTFLTCLFFLITITPYFIFLFSIFFIVGGICILAFIFFMFIKLFKYKINILILTSLILAAISFACELFLKLDLFPDFSIVTIISLYMTFAVLALSIFYRRFPVIIQMMMVPLLIYGFFICLPFTIYLLPAMAVSWILIVFMIGLLTYSPLIAAAAFIVSTVRIMMNIKKKINPVLFKPTLALAVSTAAIITVVTVFISFKFSMLDDVYRKSETYLSGKIYKDSPRWTRFALTAPKDIFTGSWIYFNDSKTFNFDFSHDDFTKFDALTYIPSMIFENTMPFDQNEKVKNAIFGDKNTGYTRLWDGDGITTETINESIQIYPENRIAYTETVIGIKNNDKYTQQEAVYTIKLPENAVAVKLSLWIGDKEEEGILTLKSKARNAYNNIVGIQRRDPAVLEWVDRGVLRLNVFPVTSSNPRRVKFGYITPLQIKQNQLEYSGAVFEGQNLDRCNRNITVDLMTRDKKASIKGKNIRFKEKLSSDDEIRQFSYAGVFNKNYSIITDNVKSGGSFNYKDEYYRISDPVYVEKDYMPDNIYVLLDSSKPREYWKRLTSEISSVKKSGARMIIVTDEFFYSDDPDKISRFIDKCGLPNFHFFPFYLMEKNKSNLIVAGPGGSSINYFDTKESDLYIKNEKFFSENKNPIYTIFLSDGGYPENFMKTLSEMGRIVTAGKDKNDLLDIFKEGRIRIHDDKNRAAFPASEFSIEYEKGTDTGSVTGNSLIPRLYYYKKLMNELGRREFLSDDGQEDLLTYANDAKIVTPISSYVVLESAKDYKENNIEKIKSKFENVEIADKKSEGLSSKLGMVPEPHEWLLIMAVISAILFIYRKFILKKIILLYGFIKRK